ncbi:MAG: GTP cyclohydrolase I FolE2 [Actinobacteria bacterium]|nr:GTP cyclohydrolase I FolE2 [Actinomycetota bacterium]
MNPSGEGPTTATDSPAAPAPAAPAPATGAHEAAIAPRRDVQAERPRVMATLSRVGVTNVEKVVRVAANGHENLFHAKLNCFVDLAAAQKGVHMSRFEEIVNEAIDEVVLREAFRAEVLAGHIAELVRERQGGARAEVSIEARYPEHKPAPVSGARTQEIYTMFGTAVASGAGTRRLVGVRAQGMTACPCAQELVAERSHARLTERGYSEQQIAEIFDSVPIATHNQRGMATLHVGCPEAYAGDIEAETLLKIAEASMSSEIYELMKRADEVEVVEKAHRRPRFVEDCVREMIAGVIAEYGDSLGTDAFVFARQENLETIHQHNVVAERYGLITEIARELAEDGAESARHVTTREWLEQR